MHLPSPDGVLQLLFVQHLMSEEPGVQKSFNVSLMFNNFFIDLPSAQRHHVNFEIPGQRPEVTVPPGQQPALMETQVPLRPPAEQVASYPQTPATVALPATGVFWPFTAVKATTSKIIV